MVTIAMITLWLCQQFAIENDPVETIDLPINSMVGLSSSLCKRLPEGITYYNYN